MKFVVTTLSSCVIRNRNSNTIFIDIYCILIAKPFFSLVTHILRVEVLLAPQPHQKSILFQKVRAKPHGSGDVTKGSDDTSPK